MLYVPAAMKVFTFRLAAEVRFWVVSQLPLTLSKVVAGEPPEVRNSLPSGTANVAVVALRKVTVTTWLVTSTTAPAACPGADTKSSCVTTVEMISDVAGLLGAVKDVAQALMSDAAGGLPVLGHTRDCRAGGGEYGGGGECGGGGGCDLGGGGCDLGGGGECRGG